MRKRKHWSHRSPVSLQTSLCLPCQRSLHLQRKARSKALGCPPHRLQQPLGENVLGCNLRRPYIGSADTSLSTEGLRRVATVLSRLSHNRLQLSQAC